MTLCFTLVNSFKKSTCRIWVTSSLSATTLSPEVYKMPQHWLIHSLDDFKASELDVLDVLQCNLAFGLSIEHLRRFSTVLTDEIDGIHVRYTSLSSCFIFFLALSWKILFGASAYGLWLVYIQAFHHCSRIDETGLRNAWRERMGLQTGSLQVKKPSMLFNHV